MISNIRHVWIMNLIVWTFLQFNYDAAALHSSPDSPSHGLSHRISRATANLDASIDRLRTVARVATAVYMTRELIAGTGKGDEIASELLKMGSATPSKINGMDVAKLKTAVTELNKLSTTLNTDPYSHGKLLTNLNAAIVIKKSMVNITTINSWPERASFEAALQSIQYNGVGDAMIRQLIKSIDRFKDAFDDAKTDASKIAELLQHSDSLITNLPQLTSFVQFSTSGTAMDAFSRIDNLINACSRLNKVDKNTTPQVAAIQHILDKLFDVAKKLSDSSADLQAVADVVLTRSRPGSLRHLIYTPGWTEGHADLTRLPSDVDSPWMKDVISSTSFEKSVGVLKQLNGPLTASSGKFGTFDEQKESIISSLKAESDKFTFIASKRAQFDTALSEIGSSKTLLVNDASEAAQVQLKVKELDDMFVHYELSVKQAIQKIKDEDLVGKLGTFVAEVRKPSNQGKSLNVIFNPISTQNAMVLLLALSSVNALLNDHSIKIKATEVVNELPKVDDFLIKQDPHFTELDKIAKIRHSDLVKDVHDLIMSADTTANPNRPDYSKAFPIVDTVKGADGSLASVLTAIGAIKGVSSTESDGLKLLVKPKKVSDHIGNAVRGIGELKKAIDAIPKMQAIISSFTLVRTERLAASNLKSEDVTQLQALETLNSVLSPMIQELNGFKTTVAASLLTKLTDSEAIFTAAKTVSGTTTDLAPMLLALDHLVAASANSNSLMPVRADLAILRNIDLDFASSHVDYDPAKLSMRALEAFFVSFAQNMTDTAANNSPFRKSKDGKNYDAKTVESYSQAAVGGSENKDTDSDNTVWIVGGCVAGVVVLLIAICAFVCERLRAQHEAKKAREKYEKNKEVMTKFNRMEVMKAVENAKEKEKIARRATAYAKSKSRNERKARSEANRAVIFAQKKDRALKAAKRNVKGARKETEKANKQAEEANKKAEEAKKQVANAIIKAAKDQDDFQKKLSYAKMEGAVKVFVKVPVVRREGSELDVTQQLLLALPTFPLEMVPKFCHYLMNLASNGLKTSNNPSFHIWMIEFFDSIIKDITAADRAKNLVLQVDQKYWRVDRPIIEETRVKNEEDDTDANFVHANNVCFATADDPHFTMIAMQAPQDAGNGKVETNSKFWKMFSQEAADTTLMLCNFVEDGVNKSSEYFPLEEKDVKDFDGIKVTCSSKKTEWDGDIIVRELHAFFPDGHTITNTHYQYLKWPEHGAPENPERVVWLMKQIRDKAMKVVVHCSDGESRTGCIALAESILTLMARGNLSVMEMCNAVRRQRYGAVENYEQIAFSLLVALIIAIDDRQLPEADRKHVNEVMSYLRSIVLMENRARRHQAEELRKKQAEDEEKKQTGVTQKAEQAPGEGERQGTPSPMTPLEVEEEARQKKERDANAEKEAKEGTKVKSEKKPIEKKNTKKQKKGQ